MGLGAGSTDEQYQNRRNDVSRRALRDGRRLRVELLGSHLDAVLRGRTKYRYRRSSLRSEWRFEGQAVALLAANSRQADRRSHVDRTVGLSGSPAPAY